MAEEKQDTGRFSGEEVVAFAEEGLEVLESFKKILEKQRKEGANVEPGMGSIEDARRKIKRIQKILKK